MRSKSVPQLSSIDADLRAGHRPARTRGSWCRSGSRRSRRRCRRWAAPPFMIQPLSSTSRVMKIGISSDDAVADRHVDDRLLERSGPRLLRVPGVANVAIWGERLEQLQVQVDPERLRAARRLADRGDGGDRRRARRRAAASTRDGAVIGTGGFIDDAEPAAPRSGTSCRSSTPEDLAEVTRRGAATAETLRLERRGRRRRRTTQPLIGDAVINDGAGPDAHRREVPVGEHPGGHRRASRRRSTRCGRA